MSNNSANNPGADSGIGSGAGLSGDTSVDPSGTLLVAIDGAAGSGKSSVARESAKRLGFGILDTGAAYRALTLSLLQAGADLDSEEAALNALQQLELQLGMTEDDRVLLTGVDVSERIRTADIAQNVSRVAKHPRVRKQLNSWFKQTVAASGLPGVIIEGRDITTVVAPDAPVRILMTAREEVRIARRAKQLPELTYEQVAADLRARDEKDLRVVDFLNPAPGVTVIDTSELDFEGSVAAVIATITQTQQER